MKLMFASDIHGSLTYCRKMLQRYDEEGAQKLILLGDILYHGPRNPLPDGYDPMGVAACLNERKADLACVRGNCDADVDQMVLQFPILCESMLLDLGGRIGFVTHGHVFNTGNMPPLAPGQVLIHGHTHVQAMDPVGENWYINPGSVSLPKEGNAHSYMIWENGVFTIRDLEGRDIRSLSL